MKKGWIRLYRKIQDSEIWMRSNEPFDSRSAWIDLLLLANHEDKTMLFDYKQIVVKRGQIFTSVRELGNRWKWGKDRVLKYLRLLEQLQMLTKDSNNKRTLLTIEKYDDFQCVQDTDKDTGEDTEQTQVRTQSRHGSATNNNEKNVKNEKNINNIKHIYGEYSHVRLTDSERDRLFNDYGEEDTLAAIKYLDEYIEMKGAKYKSHYLAMRKWVFDALKRNAPQVQNKTQSSLADKWLNA